MIGITDQLLTKVADTSSQTGMLFKVADSLLSRLAPQKQASAIMCGSWSFYGCCPANPSLARLRRTCARFYGSPLEYKLSDNCPISIYGDTL